MSILTRSWLIVIAYLIRRGTRFFASSKICIECCKVIPLSAAGISLDSFLWLETSCGTEHNLLTLLHPIPRLDRCNGLTFISEKLTGFTKIPLHARMSSISVSTPQNCKKRLWLPLHHKRHLQYQVEKRHSFSAGVKATVVFIPFNDDYYAFVFCLLSLTDHICFPWENCIVIFVP